jgi:hypothetical protein
MEKNEILQLILEYSYLIAAIMFVVGLKFMSHPETSKKGNFWAASGMVLAMITTLVLHKNESGQKYTPGKCHSGYSRYFGWYCSGCSHCTQGKDDRNATAGIVL